MKRRKCARKCSSRKKTFCVKLNKFCIELRPVNYQPIQLFQTLQELSYSLALGFPAEIALDTTECRFDRQLVE